MIYIWDYGRVLLKNCTSKLKKVQNTAARVITRTKINDHITPVLKDRKLPVDYRSQYKILTGHTHREPVVETK